MSDHDETATEEIEVVSHEEREDERPPSTQDVDVEDAKDEEEQAKGPAGPTAAVFPISRIKKIMKADPELNKCTPESVFATSLATVVIFL